MLMKSSYRHQPAIHAILYFSFGLHNAPSHLPSEYCRYVLTSLVDRQSLELYYYSIISPKSKSGFEHYGTVDFSGFDFTSTWTHLPIVAPKSGDAPHNILLAQLTCKSGCQIEKQKGSMFVMT